MGLDIRLPIGLMFTLLGILLVIYGVMGDQSIYARSLGFNVNLVWGAVLAIFGVAMLWLGRKGTSSVRLAEDDPEGRAMMERADS